MRIRISVPLIVSMVSLFGIAVCNAQDAASKAQPERQFNASCRLPNGIRVAFANETEPAGAIHFSMSMVETEGGDGIHRVFLDESRSFFFGYDVKVEPVPNTRQIRVFILPMSPEYEQRLRRQAVFQNRSVNPDFKSPSLFQAQTAQVVNDGDILAIDALVNPGTGVKIVEIVKASLEEIPLGGSPARTSPTRNFSLDDVELTVTNYRLLIDGELIAGDRPTGGCSGAIIWFYLPERGRFVFSIKPHEGYDFKMAGLIEDNKISFTLANEQYQWISSAPVMGFNGRFNLWVLHDAAYRPELDELVGPLRSETAAVGPPEIKTKPKHTVRGGLLFGAADRIEYLFRRDK